MKKFLIFLAMTFLFLTPVHGAKSTIELENPKIVTELEDEIITDDTTKDLTDSSTDDIEEEWDWESQCDNLENTVEVHNIDVWQVEDSELETMYGDEFILRRKPNTNAAWIVYELPYINKFSFITYDWPANEGEVEVLFSKDGEEWAATEMEITRIPAPEDSNCWTKLLYKAEDITGIRFVKLIWPEVDSSHNDWWNPYMGWIKGCFEESIPSHIKTGVPEEIVLPRFESIDFQLNAELVDQIDSVVDVPVIWNAKLLPDGVTLEDDTLIVDSSCTGDSEAELEVSAEYNGEFFLLPVVIKFKAPVMGDVDGDMKITQKDIEFVIENYKANEENERWKEIRIADIDKNGLIDIIDLSYVCYNTMGE